MVHKQMFFEKSDNDQSKFKQTASVGGKYFNEGLRKENYTSDLHNKLKDISFRDMEGFPIGRDEDILDLSNPPFIPVSFW